MSVRCRDGVSLAFETMRAHGVADGEPQIVTLPPWLRRSLSTRQVFSRPPTMQHRRDHVCALSLSVLKGFNKWCRAGVADWSECNCPSMLFARQAIFAADRLTRRGTRSRHPHDGSDRRW